MKNAFEYEAELTALREELAGLEDEFDTLEHTNISLKMALQAAEQRNSELIKLLYKARRSIDPSCAGKPLREELDAILNHPNREVRNDSV